MVRKARLDEGNRRLLRLAAILDKVPTDQTLPDGQPIYDQKQYVHPCGSPACALGHWAAANPKRWEIDRSILVKKDSPLSSVVRSAMDEFNLSYLTVDDLFGSYGCGKAKTGPEAAAFIRNFVANRSK
jgi:hypothetical protein